nr:formamidopyrimidine-DNA glycosylase [Deltaproteobacteria bacterium]
IAIRSPFVLRTVVPPVASLVGQPVTEVLRMGKRIVFGFESGSWLVVHLMIAGRLRWKPKPPAAGAKDVLAVLTWPDGHLVFTEASQKKRASIHVVADRSGLAAFDRGGLEVLGADRAAFAAVLRSERHTLKRTLTDPTLYSGIGNAYSDEILHRAQLSPARWSTTLDEAEIDRLYGATRAVLVEWTERFRAEVGDGFPDKVTAFRPEMAVHGKFKEPCPVCRTPVQRIAYADNETNYCPTCQTGGKLLADRALSQLLKGDWPRTLEELEERKAAAREDRSS